MVVNKFAEAPGNIANTLRLIAKSLPDSEKLLEEVQEKIDKVEEAHERGDRVVVKGGLMRTWSAVTDHEGSEKYSKMLQEILYNIKTL